MRVVPTGCIGELYLGGICPSPGYINLPKLTEDYFMSDPFSKTRGRMYRTGDLGRLLHNGVVEVLGRKDSQVKLKGYRIEQEEISNVIIEHPRIASAAVIVKNKSHLVAYFTPKWIDPDELRRLTETKLPNYMVPAVWLGLDVMPQNSNGKIDRKSLEALSVETQNEPLVTDAEKAMAGLWAELLNVDMETIGRNSSFSALGGTSISTVKLSKLVETSFKVASFSVKTIWKYPRLSTMTEEVFSSYAQIQGHSSRTTTHRIVCFHGRGSNSHHFKH
ncbi:unnamed protein product [Aphanomyces euteiches]